LRNYVVNFSDFGAEIGEWAYLKYVERKLTNVDVTLSKKETWFADNLSLVTAIANIRLL
jgi:hypothetical protein